MCVCAVINEEKRTCYVTQHRGCVIKVPWGIVTGLFSRNNSDPSATSSYSIQHRDINYSHPRMQ